MFSATVRRTAMCFMCLPGSLRSPNTSERWTRKSGWCRRMGRSCWENEVTVRCTFSPWPSAWDACATTEQQDGCSFHASKRIQADRAQTQIHDDNHDRIAAEEGIFSDSPLAVQS